MKIKYLQDHLSITKFNDVDLQNFTVLTGVNGSGKSHLLQAIEKKKVVIEGYENSNIVLFNYETFKLDNENSFNAHAIFQEREQAWNFFTQNGGGNIKNSIQSWKNNLGGNYQTIVSLCKTKKKNLFSLSKKDISNDVIFDQLKSYKQNIKNHFKNNNNLKNNPQAHAILTLIKNLSFSLDEIEEEDFLKLYKPFHFKNDFLPQQLGKIIWDYYIRYDRNEYNDYENTKKDKNYPVLNESNFIKIYGEKPWEVINKILSEFGSLKYTISSPEGSSYHDTFQLKLINKEKDLAIGFENLSSGERILMALVASIYKSSSDGHFPDILLLDEIDASLHPSMMKNLLTVINDIFLEKNVKVILVTHSPSTIALAPEESIFVMNEDGESRIEKSSKENALKILTDGFATLEEGKVLFEDIIDSSKNIILFTEGKTDIEHIKTAKEKLNINLEFDIFECGDAGKLKQFLMGIPKGLFEEKKIIGIFDFDEEGIKACTGLKGEIKEYETYKRNDSDNIFGITLPCPDQNLKKHKNCFIEFLYEKEKIIDLMGKDFLQKKEIKEVNRNIPESPMNSDDLKKEESLFVYKLAPKADKTGFAEKISELAKDDFKNFKPLFDKIEELLNSSRQEPI